MKMELDAFIELDMKQRAKAGVCVCMSQKPDNATFSGLSNTKFSCHIALHIDRHTGCMAAP